MKKRTLVARIIPLSLLASLTLGAGCPFFPPPPPTTPRVLVIKEELAPDANGRIVLASSMLSSEPGTPQTGWGLITGNGLHLYKIESVVSNPDGSFEVTTSQGALSQFGAEGKFQFGDSSSEARPVKHDAQELGVEKDWEFLDFSMPFSTPIDLTDDGSVTATIGGEFNLNGAFHLAFDVGSDGLRTFSTSIDGESSIRLKAAILAQKSTNISREKLVPGVSKTFTFPGTIAGWPVTVVVTVKLFVGIDGNVVANGTIETGAQVSPNSPWQKPTDLARRLCSGGLMVPRRRWCTERR